MKKNIRTALVARYSRASNALYDSLCCTQRGAS